MSVLIGAGIITILVLLYEHQRRQIEHLRHDLHNTLTVLLGQSSLLVEHLIPTPHVHNHSQKELEP